MLYRRYTQGFLVIEALTAILLCSLLFLLVGLGNSLVLRSSGAAEQQLRALQLLSQQIEALRFANPSPSGSLKNNGIAVTWICTNETVLDVPIVRVAMRATWLEGTQEKSVSIHTVLGKNE